MAQRPRPTRAPQRVPPRRPPVRSPYAQRRGPTCGSKFGVALLLTVVLIGVFGYILYDRTFGAIASEDVRERPESSGPPPPLLQQPFNVLLIGVDARDLAPDEGVRSDTLIVVHIDPIDKWASMLSIPRDTFVKIPYRDDVEGTKITLAYSWGFQNPEIYGEGTRPSDAGQALAADTVEEFLGLTIDYTVQVDHRGFESLVDAIDGITLDVPHAMLDAEYPTDDFGYVRLLITPGLQRMDGATALQYARTRHIDSDYGRNERQQQVLQATLCELKGRDILGRIEAVPQLVNAVTENVETTMPIDVSTLRGLAALAQDLGIDRLHRYAINPDTVALDERFDNVYDQVWDSASVKELVATFSQNPNQAATPEGPSSTVPEVATIQVQNGRGIRGLAGQVSLDLELAGFTVGDAGDAPADQEHPNTLILDYTGKRQTRERLARIFNVSPEYVRDESANGAAAPFGIDIVVRLGADYEPGQLDLSVTAEPAPNSSDTASQAAVAVPIVADTSPQPAAAPASNGTCK